MKKMGWRIIPMLFFMVLVISFWRGLSLDPHQLPSVQIGRPLPEFTLPLLANPNGSLQSNALRGKVSLLNVWASWCAACSEEQVFLLQLAHTDIPIYGVNYKDKAVEAKQWLEQWGNPYRLVGQDTDGKTAIDLGVYGAPETFIVDKKGIIRYRHSGVMNQAVWNDEMAPLVRQLEQEE